MTQRTPFIAANWKMHKTASDAVETATAISHAASRHADRQVMIAPPFTALHALSPILKDSGVYLGAQNIHQEKEGAFTGEISGIMLQDAGCSHVIVGHSERRQFFGESDNLIRLKISAVIASGMIPVFCIGETEKQRDAEETFSVLDKQVQKGLEGFANSDVAEFIVAYEPVWAIGTGKTATPEQAQIAHAYIRSRIAAIWDQKTADAVRIIYGGSVKPGNISELMTLPDVDGALVGGASLNADSFCQIVDYSDK